MKNLAIFSLDYVQMYFHTTWKLNLVMHIHCFFSNSYLTFHLILRYLIGDIIIEITTFFYLLIHLAEGINFYQIFKIRRRWKFSLIFIIIKFMIHLDFHFFKTNFKSFTLNELLVLFLKHFKKSLHSLQKFLLILNLKKSNLFMYQTT